MAIYSTDNDIRFYTTPVINEDWNAGNVMVSIPETMGSVIWAIADWFKTGPFVVIGEFGDGRLAAKFNDVYVDEVPMLVGFLNGKN